MLLWAKLQPDRQEEEQALATCSEDSHSNGGEAKHVLLPVRRLQL
jgi:hypothetical protein